jgi:nitrogen fixation protein FixH
MLVAVCLGILTFAANVPLAHPVPLMAHIEQVSTSSASSAQVRLRLTDTEGIPVDQASVTPQASMPAMAMEAQSTSVQALGQGLYLASINFSMAGAWKIDITAHADGFTATNQSIVVDVV